MNIDIAWSLYDGSIQYITVSKHDYTLAKSSLTPPVIPYNPSLVERAMDRCDWMMQALNDYTWEHDREMDRLSPYRRMYPE